MKCLFSICCPYYLLFLLVIPSISVDYDITTTNDDMVFLRHTNAVITEARDIINFDGYASSVHDIMTLHTTTMIGWEQGIIL